MKKAIVRIPEDSKEGTYGKVLLSPGHTFWNDQEVEITKEAWELVWIKEDPAMIFHRNMFENLGQAPASPIMQELNPMTEVPPAAKQFTPVKLAWVNSDKATRHLVVEKMKEFEETTMSKLKVTISEEGTRKEFMEAVSNIFYGKLESLLFEYYGC